MFVHLLQLTPNKLLIVHNCFLYPHCHGLDGRHEYVATCCYGNALLCDVSVRTPHCGSTGEGKSIAVRTKRISCSFYIFPSAAGEWRLLKGNHHHQHFKTLLHVCKEHKAWLRKHSQLKVLHLTFTSALFLTKAFCFVFLTGKTTVKTTYLHLN